MTTRILLTKEEINSLSLTDQVIKILDIINIIPIKINFIDFFGQNFDLLSPIVILKDKEYNKYNYGIEMMSSFDTYESLRKLSPHNTFLKIYDYLWVYKDSFENIINEFCNKNNIDSVKKLYEKIYLVIMKGKYKIKKLKK